MFDLGVLRCVVLPPVAVPRGRYGRLDRGACAACGVRVRSRTRNCHRSPGIRRRTSPRRCGVRGRCRGRRAHRSAPESGSTGLARRTAHRTAPHRPGFCAGDHRVHIPGGGHRCSGFPPTPCPPPRWPRGAPVCRSGQSHSTGVDDGPRNCCRCHQPVRPGHLPPGAADPGSLAVMMRPPRTVSSTTATATRSTSQPSNGSPAPDRQTHPDGHTQTDTLRRTHSTVPGPHTTSAGNTTPTPNSNACTREAAHSPNPSRREPENRGNGKRQLQRPQPIRRRHGFELGDVVAG